jgi:BirA family biotin operon repressor/biotin-[acetyl-CoA-carboxylase] ligase
VAGFALGPRAAARGYRLFGHDSIGSTSSEAMQAGLSGDAGELWVASLQQTAGRGRRGRPWQSPPGNLAASLLILPEADAGVASTLGFVARRGKVADRDRWGRRGRGRAHSPQMAQ